MIVLPTMTVAFDERTTLATVRKWYNHELYEGSFMAAYQLGFLTHGFLPLHRLSEEEWHELEEIADRVYAWERNARMNLFKSINQDANT